MTSYFGAFPRSARVGLSAVPLPLHSEKKLGFGKLNQRIFFRTPAAQLLSLSQVYYLKKFYICHKERR